MCSSKDDGMQARFHPSRSGFVLAEVLISIVILTVGILFVVDGFRAANSAAVRSIREHQATQLAKSIVEQHLYNWNKEKAESEGSIELAGIVYSWKIGDDAHSDELPGETRLELKHITVEWGNEPAESVMFSFIVMST